LYIVCRGGSAANMFLVGMDDELLYRLWGKTNERGPRPEDFMWAYHPAICHMMDVGYVAEEWLRLSPWIMNRFLQLAPGIDGEMLRRIIVTIVALHDLGKVHRSFQSKSEEGWKTGYGRAGYERKGDGGQGFDHGLSTARIIAQLAMNKSPEWMPYIAAINAVAAHHGTLYLVSQVCGGAELTGYDERMARAMIEAITMLFDMPKQAPDAVDVLQHVPFLMLLAGFASVADWFGSQSEVYSFHPVSNFSDAQNYLAMLRGSGRAERQLCEAGLLSQFDHQQHDFASLFSFEHPHPLQRRAEQVPFGDAPGSEMVVVEAPMGMGKTEIALYLAARAIGSGHAGGIYFALPTQASSNALFERVEKFAGKIVMEGGEISLALAHGGRRFYEPYRQLLEQFERSRERIGAYRDVLAAPSEVIAPAWMQSSKRTLLAAVGVGTIDQAMLGAIAVKHAFVRLFALAGKVVIFDEIHAYDAYMNELIFHLLRWLNVLGAKVILLSATLPRTLRTRLLETFGTVSSGNAGAPEDDPYPQILHLHKGLLDAPYVPLYDAGDSNPITDDKPPVVIEPVETVMEERTMRGAELALDLVERGGCIAWIRNTVREAQEAARVIGALVNAGRGKSAQVVLLHARFIRHDRNLIERSLVSILGRNGGINRPCRMIVIATQVIEQSVDIDFDAMISDLAPVDLLLQRLGRMWRHERPREVRWGHAEPVLHVLLPAAEERTDLLFGASSYVYDAETLARSAAIVLDRPEREGRITWSMPGACRALVSRLYDQGEEYWTSSVLGADAERLAGIRRRRSAEQTDLTGKARRIRMPEPDARELSMAMSLRDDDREGNVALATRHGGAGATVILLRRTNNGLQLLGDPGRPITSIPEPHEIGRILAIEHGVMLSSVSFPWYEQQLAVMKREELLGDLERWWCERHPYDNKIFLLIESDGSFTHPQFTGYYSFDEKTRTGEGLVVVKTGRRVEEVVPYDEL